MDRRIDCKRAQIPAVDADDRGARSDRPGRFLDVVHFDQCGQPQLTARSQQRPQLGIAQRRHDQQHRIRAERCRFGKLVVRDDEVLAQERDVDRGPDRARCSSEPSKNVGSVSTEIAAAPASA